MSTQKVVVDSKAVYAFNQDVSINPFPKYPGDSITTTGLEFKNGGIAIIEKPAPDTHPMRTDYGKQS